ncbi:unnamed protein product [Aspergillus oryzae var. brunneus]|uniref:Unnamed protein product n=1 Tax=Aspergillus oryzae var. brunneus TaxID=332754 RepID=A0ABQ6KAT0_ASPOZ|nr:unnamed protein product [Aspergillus oryzae]GMG41689.1 unnamed protein product [Aspergillus oryzae var. brunneus]
MAYSILQIALATLLGYFVLVDAAIIQQTRAEAHPPKAKVQNGTYVGVHNDHYNIDYFLGIPFAQPPIGILRLAPPVSLNSSFSGTRNATNLQPVCVQFQWQSTTVSMDLAFWVVLLSKSRALPILVSGTSALHFIGSSAGSQLLAYGGRNDSLFRAAIADSDGPLAFKSPSNATQLQTWESILNLTGCSTASDSMACLRGVSSANLSYAVNASRVTFMPITDGGFVETHSSAQLLNGQFVQVPLLTGTNTDEGTNFVGSPSHIGALPTIAYPNDTSFLDYIGQSITNTTASAAALAALSVLYPDIPAIGVPHSHKGRLNSTFGSQYARVATFAGDFMAHRDRRLSAQMWFKYNVPVYTYRFNQWPIGGLPDTTGTTHFTEIPLVQDHEVQDGYLAPWYPAGGEFTSMDSDFYALARLMNKAPIPPLVTFFRCYLKTP